MSEQDQSASQPNKISVWTFNSDPAAGAVSPIRTTCTAGPFGGGRADDEGRRMFINTHFLTEGEAWDAITDNAEAATRSATTAYRRAQASLREATQQIADYGAHGAEVREARLKAGA